MIYELEEMLEELSEASNHNGYLYSVKDILIIMVCGLLCGLQTVSSIKQWATVPRNAKFFNEIYGINKIPCIAQIYNILRTVDASFFEKCFIKWMKELIKGDIQGKTIALDGKSIRSTGKRFYDKSIMHIASAIISESQLVIGSAECDKSTGEIDAVRHLIKILDIEGAVVVADALHCQTETAEAVIAAKADYLFIVKGNQKNLKESVDLLSYNKRTDTDSTVEINGGRVETRTAYVSNQIDTLYNKEIWQNISCVGVIHREFEKNGKVTTQNHYYISSKDMTATELLHHARMEWRVEVMHWLLDVHFDEDKTRLLSKKVQKSFNLMRKIVLNLVKEYQTSLPKQQAQSAIMRSNLFDIDNLKSFIAHFA